MRQSSKTQDLRFFALFALTFGAMMGSGVFDIPQNIANHAGAVAVIINWVIVSIGMLALATSFIYISRHRPDIHSGIYGYAKYGLGDYVGFNAAWGYWLNALLGNASYLIYIFATLGNFFVVFGRNNHAGSTLPALLGESVAIWIIYFLINQGIRNASYVNIFISTIKVLALSTLTIMFIYGFHWHIFRANISTHDLHLGSLLTQIKSSMLITVWDFIGIEAACIYALHAKSMKDIGRATMLSVVCVLAIDILLSLLPFGILNTATIQILHTPSTAGVLFYIIGPLSANLIRFAVIVCVLGALLAWQMLATNILYVAALDNTLPKIFSQHNKAAIPHMSLLFSSITLQVFILCAYFTGAIYINMIQIATSLILIPYLLTTIFALKLMFYTGKIHFYDIFKGSVALLYAVWLIYAGGIKYLAISSIMYFLGIFIFIWARRENNKKIFNNLFELLVFVIITLTAFICLVLWWLGMIALT